MMSTADLFEKYLFDISGHGFNYYVGVEDIPEKVLKNAKHKIANGASVSNEEILALYDTSVTENGSTGYLFCETKAYWKTSMEKPQKVFYSDIEHIEVEKTSDIDYKNAIVFYLIDGTKQRWDDWDANKSPLCKLFNELISAQQSNMQHHTVESIPIGDYSDGNSGAFAGGYTTSSYQNTNKLYNEEKFHARQGHGFAAEQANDLYDQLTGHKVVKNVGDSFAKNGADRIVDGIEIQSKYCATGSRCINECFEADGKGAFRYYNSQGKPMQIEVPSDKYEAALQSMEEKIRNGQVAGVSDPAEAKNIVKKGHFTYQQAKNIAKAGTIESITYDAVNGAIISSTALGITAAITFATQIWNGESFEVALKNATFSGLKIGGTAFITTILSGQLAKAGLNSALVSSSEAIVSFMGPKASAIMVNAFRSGGNIYGAAAMKSAAKLLRGNAITGAVTVVVLSSFDVANIFRGRISGKQLFKNLANTTVTVGAGTGGWIAGAAAGSAIFPGVGTVIGGLIGSLAAGAAAGKASSAVLNTFIEDDAEEMTRIIEKRLTVLASDYLLNKDEVEKTVDELGKKLDGKKLKEMFASKKRNVFADNMLSPIIEKQVLMRRKITLPSESQTASCIRLLLEEMSDSLNLDFPSVTQKT